MRSLGNKQPELKGKWTGKKVGILVDFGKNELYIMDKGRVWWQYKVSLAQNTSYYFHFWLDEATDSVTIFPPTKLTEDAVLALTEQDESKEFKIYSRPAKDESDEE